MKQTIHSTAACVIQQGERFLMVEEARGGPTTVFNQPAGHIEPGEGPITAILREVAEETAWQVTLTGYLGLYIFHTPQGKTFHSHGFIATPKTFLDTPLDRDITATHWLTLDEIQALNHAGRLRSPLVVTRIEDAMQHHHYPLEVIRE
ncbi:MULTISPECIES: NUDIX domain-containing protein [unclassified Halomonas]|uniref:NUDIX domain-containing protein n=1 Tax=unclassified Halomonas TaxID=2609666 RepID=UPI0006DB138F|nr:MULTISPECIES: NUDIX domain-containing protein [unclassified Halomonas]KPQ28043.1 MAG: ADP-ribose pyrophosphatase [Halomonas sp. HL-93]SBR50106.1 ADP-ribose pyrophosphatase YjhB, NUDIX family [Halomonas sp. HL-93]SNY96681.1 ADP-ribose pyrophosphatase YjhB, NUDIX family [Halomonas sp. hl-4]